MCVGQALNIISVMLLVKDSDCIDLRLWLHDMEYKQNIQYKDVRLQLMIIFIIY